MITVDEVKELEKAPSTLPPLYSAWMVHALEGPLPQETKATCDNCVMCPSASTPIEPGASYFHPETKCCTYLPELPNFLIGRILADESPDLRAGRLTVEERMQKRAAVTPLGFGQDAVYHLLSEQGNGTLFGKSRALRCPHYLEDGGRCGIWKHRHSWCATWFCKHDRGAAGARFWAATKQLLDVVEEGLASWCVSQLDVGTDALKLLFPSAQQDTRALPLERHLLDEGSADPALYNAIWGKWAGREKDFYRACADLVDPLSWEEVCSICGPKLSIFLRMVQEAYTALQSTRLPTLLQVRPYRTTKVEPGYSEAVSYSEYDPIRLSKVLRDVLPYFDGRPLEAVRESIKTEKKVALNDGLIRKLIDHDILGPTAETKA